MRDRPRSEVVGATGRRGAIAGGPAGATAAALLASLVLAVTGPEGVSAQEPEPLEYPGMTIEHHVQVPADDGTLLSLDLYRPTDEERRPTIFLLTPYDNNSDGVVEEAWRFVRRGYAYATADVRGRYDSEGRFEPWRNDAADGSALISWIAEQPWSDGRVGTIGGSYLGMNQWLIAGADNPHHVAMAPYVAPADGFRDAVRFDGVPKLDLIYTWSAGMYGRVNQSRRGFDWRAVMNHLPLHTLGKVAGRPLPFWTRWMEENRLGPYWEPMTVEGRYGDIDVPSFNVTGWWDGQLVGTTKHFTRAVETAEAPDDHVLIIGPWLHGVNRDRTIGERSYGPEAIIELSRLRNEWLDHVLLGEPRPDLPPVRYFLQVRNEWRDADAWPLPETRWTRFHLDSEGDANTLFGDGRLRREEPGRGPADTFTYDPMDPVPTLSSRTAGARSGIAQGAVDNRAVETRDDVLVYTSEPLDEGIEVTGPVRATIYFSTDVPDTDITVKLLDVDPSGRALNISHGIARARYRDSFTDPEPLESGAVQTVDVTMFPTSNWFARGHRIRIEVSSSNFPLFGRNLNVEASPDTSARHQIAETSIHHTPDHPSHILLPVIPR